jgi:hypothetical protein
MRAILQKKLAPLYSFVFAKPESEESGKYLKASWDNLWLSKETERQKEKEKKVMTIKTILQALSMKVILRSKVL